MEANYHSLYNLGEEMLDFAEYCEYDSSDYNDLYAWFKEWLSIQGLEYINTTSDEQMMRDFIEFAFEAHMPGTHTVWLKIKTKQL